MHIFDILGLAWRNLREAKLRAALTTIGVVVGVAVIVIMVSFGLGLERNTIARFRELDLFNEITVYGRTLSSIVSSQLNQLSGSGGANQSTATQQEARRPGAERSSERTLDESAVREIAKLPGVAYVEPNVSFTAYVRANGRVVRQTVSGALVPNQATRFREFAAGRMITQPETNEAAVDQQFVHDFGYDKATDAVGQTVELLAPPKREEARRASLAAESDKDALPQRGNAASREGAEGDEPLSFFGLPLEAENANDAGGERLVAASFRIVGVLQNEVGGNGRGKSGGRRFRGLMPAAGLYVPLAAAQNWTATHRDAMNEVALQLARLSGAIGSDEMEGYPSAVVRVSDPSRLLDVKNHLAELGFNSFSIVDQLDELQKVFLIANSAFALLGGISLLVASFGIANTMIMSIYERTREIGIMKAIGAEDREIKLIFFFEAALIGLAGGIIGVLAAWGIQILANRLAYEFILRPRDASFINFFALPPWLWIGAILFAMLVAILAALYPAARAARIDPVRALRHD